MQPRRGRPRDPAVDRAIVESAREVFARRGFTGASMDEIARTAGVGKDTLYRRWKSKELLVQHVLTVLAAENVPVPLDDDPRYALYVFLQDIVRLNTRSDFGAILAGIVGESARNPELATAFHQFWSERRSIAADLVRRIVDPDTPDRGIDHGTKKGIGHNHTDKEPSGFSTRCISGKSWFNGNKGKGSTPNNSTVSILAVSKPVSSALHFITCTFFKLAASTFFDTHVIKPDVTSIAIKRP